MEYTMNKHEMLKGALVYDLIYNYQASAIRAKDKVILDEMYTRYPGLVLSPEEQDQLLEDTIDQLNEAEDIFRVQPIDWMDIGSGMQVGIERDHLLLKDDDLVLTMHALKQVFGVDTIGEYVEMTTNQQKAILIDILGIDGPVEETITRADLYDIAKGILTDYNDNFVGDPCQEIVEEVVSYIEDTDITESQAREQIEEIAHNMFD